MREARSPKPKPNPQPPLVWLAVRSSGFTPGTFAEGDGVLVARAMRALSPGERLTINYGPAELVTVWPLQQRREYLQKHCGFVCGCEKCVREEAGLGAPAAAEAAAVTATVEASVLMPSSPPTSSAPLPPMPSSVTRRKKRKSKKGGGGGAAEAEAAAEVAKEAEEAEANGTNGVGETPHRRLSGDGGDGALMPVAGPPLATLRAALTSTISAFCAASTVEQMAVAALAAACVAGAGFLASSRMRR